MNAPSSPALAARLLFPIGLALVLVPAIRGQTTPARNTAKPNLADRLTEFQLRCNPLAEEILGFIGRAGKSRVDLDIEARQAIADRENAVKTWEVAQIALTEYLEGTFPQKADSLEGDITLARVKMIEWKEYLQGLKNRPGRGAVPDQATVDAQIALLKAEIEVKRLESEKKNFLKFVKPKELARFQDDVVKADADRRAKEAALAKVRERLAASQAEGARFLKEEADALDQLDEALQLEARVRAAIEDPDAGPGVAADLLAQANFRLDHAQASWRQAVASRAARRTAELRTRVRAAATAVREEVGRP